MLLTWPYTWLDLGLCTSLPQNSFYSIVFITNVRVSWANLCRGDNERQRVLEYRREKRKIEKEASDAQEECKERVQHARKKSRKKLRKSRENENSD